MHPVITTPAVAAAVALLSVGCAAPASSSTLSPTTRSAATTVGAAPAATAKSARPRTPQAVLASLPVKGRGAKTGYSRTLFRHWADLDRNGCDTRNEILRSQMTKVKRSGACRVISGVLVDPYSGRTINCVRVGPQLVDIDHVVPLGNAWVSGASNSRTWTATKRAQFANDPLNLLAVDARLNRAKGDADASTWAPPLKSARCEYAARQVAVKAKYGLSVTPAEKTALNRYLAPGCALPTGGARPVTPRTPTTRPAPTPTPRPTQKPTPTPSTNGVAYANCAAARAAGAAPLHRGDPGYSLRLDRDQDGVACE